MSNTYGTFQKSKTLVEIPKSGAVIKIQPFGDIHRDSHNCNVDKWKQFLKTARETHDEYTYYIGMGDYNDFASYTERKALHAMHESSILKMDDWARHDVEKLVDELSFMKGKLLGLHHGNHEWKFNNGQLATEYMCDLLEAPFLGYASYVRILTKYRNSRCGKIDIFASHGKGGGQLLGSPYNSVEKMKKIFNNADIYLMGHDHKKGAISSTVLQMNQNMHETQLRQWCGRTGSFLKGWVTDEPSYCIGRMYPPTDLGTIRFECNIKRMTRKGVDTYVKDIHCWS